MKPVIGFADVSSLAQEFGLRPKGGLLSQYGGAYELSGVVSERVTSVTIPRMPQGAPPVTVDIALSPALDLGLELKRDQLDPYEPLAVKGDEESRVEALLEGELRAALGPCRFGANLSDGLVQVFADNPYGELFEKPYEDLRAMMLWAMQLAELVHASRAKVPCASELRTRALSWEAWAKRESLEISTCPLGVAGALGRTNVWVNTIRTKPQSYRFELWTAFEAVLPFAVSLRPSSVRDKVADLVGAGDMHVGYAPFDKAFFIETKNESKTGHMLGGEVARELYDLSTVGEVKADTTGIALRVAGDMSPDDVIALANRLAAVTTTMFKRAFGLHGGGSAYR